MRTVRLVREVPSAGCSGPVNGQYALQKALRERLPPWLQIGGRLRPDEIPWFWCWMDRGFAVYWSRTKRPFILGPNIFFESNEAPCAAPGERELCDSRDCLLQFTESAWYRDLIAAHSGPRNRAPIVLWPYPIDPQPEGPLPAEHDLLIYAKSGYEVGLPERLCGRIPRTRVLVYGQFQRSDLFEAARRSRVCLYLSNSDRGPLALAEILLAGCPSVGMAKGAPWVLEGRTGSLVECLDESRVLAAIQRAGELDRESVRTLALDQFNTAQTVETILTSLRDSVAQYHASESRNLSSRGRCFRQPVILPSRRAET
jgi:hypothetical protein